MEIVFKDGQSSEEAAETLTSVLQLFKERYGVCQFREMRLEVVMMDKEGDDVELIDAKTQEAFRVFEVYRAENMPKPKPALKLVVDNAHSSKK